MKLVKTIVVKPTMNCNLRCGYCYEFIRNGAEKYQTIMSVEQLNDVIRRTARLFPESQVLWMLHGGEPLLQGIDYFKSFVDCVNEVNQTYNVNFQIALQTNATLLSKEHVAILEENEQLLSERIVSISIDGPKEINDITRHSLSGESAYQDTISAMQRVKDSKLDFSTISVIADHNVDKAPEIFKYMQEKESSLCKYIPCYNFNSNGETELHGIYPMQFAKFMCEMFDLWMHNLPHEGNNRMVIEPIASIICNLVGGVVTWCEYRPEKCNNFTCIYPDGEMWLCDNFIHETMKKTAYVKNVFSVTDAEYEESLLTPERVCGYNEFYDEMMSDCKKCDIYDYCKGGCITTRCEMLKKSKRLYDEYCEAKKLLIAHIKRGVDLALS